MAELNWQKSSYSEEGSSCVYVVAAADGTLRLRESNEPDTIATVSQGQLRALIRRIRATGTGADTGPAENAHWLTQLSAEPPV